MITNENLYLDMREISIMVEKSYNYVRKELKKANVEPAKKELNKYNYVFYYNIEDVKRVFKIIEIEVEKVFTIKETEVYHIYESKMNYIQDL